MPWLIVRKKLPGDWSRVSMSARPPRSTSGLLYVLGPSTLCVTHAETFYVPCAHDPTTHEPSHAAPFINEVCLLKIFYLSHMSSVLSTDCTVVFYVTRQTKLNHTCIYFEDVYNSSKLCINWTSCLSKKLLWYTCISCYDIYI